MIAEPPANPPRNRPQTSRPDVDHGRETGSPGQPPMEGDYPTDGKGTPVGLRDGTSPEDAPSRQEYPELETDDETFWEAAHQDQSFAGDDDYERYAAAYRIGYEGHQRLGAEYAFEDVEEDLQEEYEAEGSSLPWERARDATRAAWDRMESRKQNTGNAAGAPVP